MSETSEKYEELCSKRLELKQRIWSASNDKKLERDLEKQLSEVNTEIAKEAARPSSKIKVELDAEVLEKALSAFNDFDKNERMNSVQTASIRRLMKDLKEEMEKEKSKETLDEPHEENLPCVPSEKRCL